MSIKKFARLPFDTSSAYVHREGKLSAVNQSSIKKIQAQFEGFEPEPGFLYVVTRAISSRVNANYDGWPPDQLRTSYRSFVGRPVFVDHNNWNLSRSRGVVIDGALAESKLASGDEDVAVKLLVEVDAKAFPKLAQAIISGDIDAVSMGADVEYTICSVCSNVAHDVTEYCAHIPSMKGKWVQPFDRAAGIHKEAVLCYEDCYGVNFFELSFVFDPADESALISDAVLYSGDRVASRGTIRHLRQEGEPLKVYQQRLHGMSRVASRQVYATSAKELDDFIKTVNEEAGRNYELGGAYGNHELWEDGNRLEVGTKKDIREYLIKNRFKPKKADKTLLTIPTPVDTLREDQFCPQCGAEWDGMSCENCGWEQPPMGLGDPETDPAEAAGAMAPPVEGVEPDEEAMEEADENDEAEPPAPKNKGNGKDKSKSKDKGKSKKGAAVLCTQCDHPAVEHGELSGCPYCSCGLHPLQARLNQDPKRTYTPNPDRPYTPKKGGSMTMYGEFVRRYAAVPTVYDQSTAEVTNVPPYGEGAGAGGQATPPPEAPFATSEQLRAEQDQVDPRSIDTNEISGGPGSSEVSVPGEEGQQSNSYLSNRAEAYAKRAELLEKQAKYFRARAFEIKANEVGQDDVENLDSGGPPAVDFGPDATINVTAPTDEGPQTQLADEPGVVNDGSETGEEITWKRPAEDGTISPFNDAANEPYRRAAARREQALRREFGLVVEGSITKEAARTMAENAAKQARAHIVRVTNLVETRVNLGLTPPSRKLAEIARFEQMGDRELEGFIEATKELQMVRGASPKRTAVSPGRTASRVPELGATSQREVTGNDQASDFVALM